MNVWQCDGGDNAMVVVCACGDDVSLTPLSMSLSLLTPTPLSLSLPHQCRYRSVDGVRIRMVMEDMEKEKKGSCDGRRQVDACE